MKVFLIRHVFIETKDMKFHSSALFCAAKELQCIIKKEIIQVGLHFLPLERLKTYSFDDYPLFRIDDKIRPLT